MTRSAWSSWWPSGIGVAAIVLGEADDSPGLQLLGVLLVIGTVALGVRTAQRSK